MATSPCVSTASSTPAEPPPAKPAPTGIASFNMAWAGTAEDFKKYLDVCGAPAVNWCDTRARTLRGASGPTAEEQARAKQCEASILSAAGGPEASMMVAPCNAYRINAPFVPGAPPVDQTPARKPEAYAQKLKGLQATVERLVEQEGIKVIAFQEVKSKAVIDTVLGKFAPRFENCVATHNAFQTIAFAWDKSVTSKPGVCTTHSALAIKDPPNDPAAFRRVRPGLALELVLNGAPVTFMNVHLKSGCANIVATERFPARLLTDANDACDVLNRQVPLLEDWLDGIAAKSPRLVWLGDFNRRIDEEAAANIAKDQVRSDGSDAAGPNKVGADGKVATKYLWQELSDGKPTLHQVPLSP
ncbi:MAG: hypothetical protein JNJ55_01755, partial [Betaproteobacteria bacterium]|nr:hypothetical protein [Betaproteobacteria bacterium]